MGAARISRSAVVRFRLRSPLGQRPPVSLSPERMGLVSVEPVATFLTGARAMKRLTLIAAMASALAVGGCAQNPYTGEHQRTATGATVGAGAGALLGNVIAGSGNKTGGTLIGAAVGATVGGLVGRQMDQQERQLRQDMAGTGVDVRRQGDTIRLQAPESITFETNSAAIRPQFRQVLSEVAASVQQYPNTVVRVEGHTDSTGAASYNQ